MTEEMHNHIFTYWYNNKEVWDKHFHYISSKKEWEKLLNTPCYELPQLDHYIYNVGDITYIFTRIFIFGLVDIPNYGKLHNTYWYVFYYRASEKITVDTNVETAMNGKYAWNIFYRALKKYYTMEEIQEVIKEHGYPDEESPMHNHIYQDTEYKPNTIYTFTNVAYYDLNKAYAANLIKFFPKLKKWALNGYKKNKPRFKKVINYAVGCMQNKTEEELNFRLLRNAIVHNTNVQMNEAFSIVNHSIDSQILYVNTDGFIVNNPTEELNYSDKLGDFGKEIVDNNTIKFLKVKNAESKSYTIMQWFENGEKVVKSIGGFLQQSELIQHVDLFNNKSALFKTTKVFEGVDDNGRGKSKEVVNFDTLKEIEF